MFTEKELLNDVAFFDEQLHTIEYINSRVLIVIDGGDGSGCGKNDGDREGRQGMRR